MTLISAALSYETVKFDGSHLTLATKGGAYAVKPVSICFMYAYTMHGDP